MEQNKLKIACDSLGKVKEYRKSKNFGRAFAHYLVYLELTPKERSKHEKQFSELLSRWCIELEERKQYEDLYTCYLQGMNYYPLSFEILNNFGAHLLRLEQEQQAKKYVQLAHNLNKQYLPAEKNLSTIKQMLVPRWHFRMLNDDKRNKTYHDAIASAITPTHNRVLDIGTGCGLLSLFASKNIHTLRIDALEESATLCELARDIFRANDINNVHLINKNSTELNNLNNSNVLITEIFDAGFFGEHMLRTLIHAHEFLLAPDSRIIPGTADVFVTGIECEQIQKRQKFMNYDLKRLIFKDLCVRKVKLEPYEAENIDKYNCNYLTDTVKFVTVDLSDAEQLKGLYNMPDYINNCVLNTLTAGELHAFVVWFDLKLEDQIITTNPFKDNCKCWEQAVVYLEHPLRIEQGDKISLQISCTDDILDIKTDQKTECSCFEVPQDIVEFLNCHPLLETIEKLSQYFQGDNLIVLDLFPVPIFGLNLAARNCHVFSICRETDFVQTVCKINGIDTDNITFITEDELYRYLECKSIFDIIIFDPVSKNGTINEKFYNNQQLFMNSLKESGLILPQSVLVNLQVIDGGYLEDCVRVDDGHLFGFKIADYINEYMVPEHWQLDNNFEHKKLSNVISTNIAIENGDEIIKSFQMEISDSGNANSIMYWYTINFFNNTSYNTINSSFYKKACFISKAITVNARDIINISFKQHKGLLKIEITP